MGRSSVYRARWRCPLWGDTGRLSQHQEGRAGGFLPCPRGPRVHAPHPSTSPAGPLTLRAHQHHGHLAGVTEAAEPQEVVVHRLETDFILQAEHEHHRIHPGSKLGGPSRITPCTRSWGSSTPLCTHTALPDPNPILGQGAPRAGGGGQEHHLELRGAAFISDQQQVTLAIHHNLLLKPTP